VLRFNRFQERRQHDVIGTQSCQSIQSVRVILR